MQHGIWVMHAYWGCATWLGGVTLHLVGWRHIALVCGVPAHAVVPDEARVKRVYVNAVLCSPVLLVSVLVKGLR
eukprot:gene10684-biopygen1078